MDFEAFPTPFPGLIYSLTFLELPKPLDLLFLVEKKISKEKKSGKRSQIFVFSLSHGSWEFFLFFPSWELKFCTEFLNFWSPFSSFFPTLCVPLGPKYPSRFIPDLFPTFFIFYWN